MADPKILCVVLEPFADYHGNEWISLSVEEYAAMNASRWIEAIYPENQT
ncbi:hypothetical protein LCGC14_2272570, partial [marine sediment metagenome]